MEKPTYGEFLTAVKSKFKQLWKLLSDEEAEKYLDSESDFIHMRYQEYSDRFDSGNIDQETFMVGGVASVAHCLEMMY